MALFIANVPLTCPPMMQTAGVAFADRMNPFRDTDRRAQHEALKRIALARFAGPALVRAVQAVTLGIEEMKRRRSRREGDVGAAL